MESRIRVLLLTAALLVLPGFTPVSAATSSGEDTSRADGDAQPQGSRDAPPDDENPPVVVEPEVERRKVKVPGIHSSNIEIALHYGALEIEDFGTNPAYGGYLAYHVTEDFFLRGDVGRSSAGETSAESLAKIPLNIGNRHFTYYNVSLGYNFLPGEAFLGRGTAINSTFYVLAGIGTVDFAQSKKFAANFGGGFKVLPTTWATIGLEVEDHLFQSDILGYSKLTNNLEARIVTSVFF
jgi:outer membrane beta-barrel protein